MNWFILLYYSTSLLVLLKNLPITNYILKNQG